jgi:hypothetical protein
MQNCALIVQNCALSTQRNAPPEFKAVQVGTTVLGACRTEQNRTEQNRTEQNRTNPEHARQYITDIQSHINRYYFSRSL